ncbi:hypothetical protein [Myxosarcina sp. GI1]|uniref:hypothetical protein n=1 Tax=Myxosarcina sp. GI1 TaxID=1541065 RepID=UPI000568DA6F|nr:hypothetical protein [Myxosarcina sp. GI1]
MAIIALKAWYIKQYEPIKETIAKPYNLRLSRNSLLKSGLRVDFLDDRSDIEGSEWFGRYLEGETVEFYIEGSGNYLIANIDLISQEIYFTKKESLSGLDPIIYFSPQYEYSAAADISHSTLQKTVTELSERSRIPLSLETAPRQDSPLRLSDSQLKRIRKSLLFIADTTPTASVATEKTDKLLLNSNVCVEIGYALQSKDSGQILLLSMERSELTGELPFEVANYKRLSYKNASQLEQTLPQLVESLLQKFKLFV